MKPMGKVIITFPSAREVLILLRLLNAKLCLKIQIHIYWSHAVDIGEKK